MPGEENRRKSSKNDEETCASGLIQSEGQLEKSAGDNRKDEDRAEKQHAGAQVNGVLVPACGGETPENVSQYG